VRYPVRIVFCGFQVQAWSNRPRRQSRYGSRCLRRPEQTEQPAWLLWLKLVGDDLDLRSISTLLAAPRSSIQCSKVWSFRGRRSPKSHKQPGRISEVSHLDDTGYCSRSPIPLHVSFAGVVGCDVAQPFADKTQYSRCGCILANVPAGGSDAFGIIIVISTMLVWQIAAGSFQTKKADTSQHRQRKVAGQNLCDTFALHMVNGEAQYLERRHLPSCKTLLCFCGLASAFCCILPSIRSIATSTPFHLILPPR
jgi:hypothetical protein